MKITIDFVTNSSSSSFIIPKKYLTDLQILMIYNHMEIAIALTKGTNIEIWKPEWKIEEDKNNLKGYTSIDNFDMYWFLEEIGVNMENVAFI